VLWKVPFKTFFGILSSSILIIWPAHPSLVIFISSTLFKSLYRVYISLFALPFKYVKSKIYSLLHIGDLLPNIGDKTLLLLFSLTLQPSAGYGLLVTRGFLITHSDTPQSVGFLLTSDQLVAETTTLQYTKQTTDKHPSPRWDSNRRSQ
jgi:hypothetical protein